MPSERPHCWRSERSPALRPDILPLTARPHAGSGGTRLDLRCHRSRRTDGHFEACAGCRGRARARSRRRRRGGGARTARASPTTSRRGRAAVGTKSMKSMTSTMGFPRDAALPSRSPSQQQPSCPPSNAPGVAMPRVNLGTCCGPGERLSGVVRRAAKVSTLPSTTARRSRAARRPSCATRSPRPASAKACLSPRACWPPTLPIPTARAGLDACTPQGRQGGPG